MLRFLFCFVLFCFVLFFFSFFFFFFLFFSFLFFSFLSFPFLSFPFLSFPFLSFPFLSFPSTITQLPIPPKLTLPFPSLPHKKKIEFGEDLYFGNDHYCSGINYEKRKPVCIPCNYSGPAGPGKKRKKEKERERKRKKEKEKERKKKKEREKEREKKKDKNSPPPLLQEGEGNTSKFTHTSLFSSLLSLSSLLFPSPPSLSPLFFFFFKRVVLGMI